MAHTDADVLTTRRPRTNGADSDFFLAALTVTALTKLALRCTRVPADTSCGPLCTMADSAMRYRLSRLLQLESGCEK